MVAQGAFLADVRYARCYTAFMKISRITIIIIAALVVAFLLGWALAGQGQGTGGNAVSSEATAGAEAFGLGSTDAELARLFEAQQDNTYVTGTGVVERILSDDTEGSQHQRFILRLASGQTLLVAHNIDIAPRVKPLAVGDTVDFAGVYEFNEEGGVIHWTHHDPVGKHRGGFLRVGGKEFS
jgi:ABC-type glycerol-3-phosphate transport system substrate-binding protein